MDFNDENTKDLELEKQNLAREASGVVVSIVRSNDVGILKD